MKTEEIARVKQIKHDHALQERREAMLKTSQSEPQAQLGDKILPGSKLREIEESLKDNAKHH